MNQKTNDPSSDETTGQKQKSFFIVELNRVDCLTLMGILLVGSAVVLMLQGQFSYALSILYLALIADAMDGVLARKLGITRDFGRYLDGFVDVFDYLVAPVLFLYLLGFDAWYQCLVLAGMVATGVIRLSVFNEAGNIEDEQGLGYLGMPVFWSALLLGPVYLVTLAVDKAWVFALLCLLIPVYSIANLHNGRYYKFKSPKLMLGVLLGAAVLFALLGLMGERIVDHLMSALFAIIPLIVGGILHMIAVTKDWLPQLKIPLSPGLFGANKTLRGFILMPLFTVPGAYLTAWLASLGGWQLTFGILQQPAWLVGLVLGLGYMVAELPNSFLKRRMGAAPGESPDRHRVLFIMLDQLDSAIGCALVYVIWLSMPLTTLLVMFAMAPLLALSIKRVLFFAKLKKSAT